MAMAEDALRKHTANVAWNLAVCIKTANAEGYESVQEVGGIKYRVRVELDDGADLGDWKPYGSTE